VRKGFGGLSSMAFATLAAIAMFPSATRNAQTGQQSNSEQGETFKKFLQDYLKDPSEDGSTRYIFVPVNLSDHGKREVIAYITGPSWCGSGGCTMLILTTEGSRYRVVAKVTIVRPPIRVLATKSHGWHDLSMQAQGGGITNSYEVGLYFNGRSYTRNPSVLPARRLAKNAPGDMVIPSGAEGKPLYP